LSSFDPGLAPVELVFDNGLDVRVEVSVAAGSMCSVTDVLDRTDTRPAAHPADEWVAAPADLPVRMLAAVRDTVSNLDDVLWAAKPPEVLLATMRELEGLRSVLDTVQLHVVAEIEATGAAASEGWASTKDYVTAVTGGPKGAGRRTVAPARAITGDRAATGTALGLGWIPRTQAEVIVDAVDRLPVNPGLRDAAERLLVSEAQHSDATDLARRGRYVLERLDPEGVEHRDERLLEREERAAHHSRFLSITDDGIGGVRLKGRGTVEDAAWLRSVLLPLAAPEPTGPSGSCGVAPSVADAVRSCGVAECAHDGRDPREHGARMWDALVEAARRLAGAESLPECHGARPRVSVTVSHDALVNALGEGRVDTGGTLSAGAVRRLACDAGILPVVLGSASQVLDVGRSSRLVTPGLWLALVARDRHCAFPGCTRMPVACDAHHIVHWADGGATSLANLVLLCRRHHTTVHTTPWEVRLHPDDGRPEFLPPPRPHRERRPLRRRPLRE
jgi:hypothetical protein